MMPTVFRHRVSSLRRRATTVRRTETELSACVQAHHTQIRFADPGKPLDDAFLRNMSQDPRPAAILPLELHGELVVEAGVVEQSLSRAGRPATARRWRYLMASCRGVLIALGELDELRWRSQWRRLLDFHHVESGLPVMLGPSAALAAALHVLEVGESEEVIAALPAALSIETDKRSPYPPHMVPPELRELPFDPVLLHLQACSRPFAALSNDGFPTAALRCAAACAAPSRALVLESMLPLRGGSGPIEWEVQCSVVDGDGAALSRRARRVILDAAAALGSAQAAGATQPAMAEDAVWGETYGWAPPLMTDLRTGDLWP